MKTMPAIGTRVIYTEKVCGETRTCTGVVYAQYPGYGERCYDEELGRHWTMPDFAGVAVDQPLPDWWVYETNEFAPEISTLEEQTK